MKPKLVLQPLLIYQQDYKNQKIDQIGFLIKNLASLKSINVLGNEEDTPISAIALLGKTKILIPLEGLIDIEEEKKRLNKKHDKYLSEIGAMNNRLKSKGFIEKAPKEVVDELKNKLEKVEYKQERIKEQIKMLSND